MKSMTFAFTVILLLASTCANALVERSFRALVVSVDVKAKTMTFRHADQATPTNWKEMTAVWDDATKWERSEKIGKDVPATADLAQQLKKDSKIYISVSDRFTNEKEEWIESVSTLGPDASVP